MRIYFIGQKGIPATSGGVERHVDEIAVRLAALGHEVFAYVRPYYTPEEIKEYKGVHLIHLPSIRTKHLDAISHTILASIHVLFQKADIIHYHAIGPSLMIWLPKLLKPKAKIVATFHSDDTRHKKWGKFARFMLNLGSYFAVRWPDASIAVSKEQQATFSEKYSRKMIYLPNGVPTAEKVKPQLITEKWGLDGNDYILAVSRLIRHKGIQYLIRAYTALKDNHGKKLVIVGDASFTNDFVKYLKALAAGNENIIFTGEQTGQTLAELLSNAYIFVQPSEYEGLSIALLEAMSYGLPVIVSNIPANVEVIENIGLSFQNKNVSDLAEKLSYLLSNPNVCAIMRGQLIERVTNDYNWDKIVIDLSNLYCELIERGRRMPIRRALSYITRIFF